jgi:hypothetical protein
MSRTLYQVPGSNTGRRKDSRVRLHLQVMLVMLDRTVVCLLDDISRTGARLTMKCPPSRGCACVLKGHGIEPFCTVVWSAFGRCGLQFDERLTLDQVVALRHYADGFQDHVRHQRETAAREFVQGKMRL